LEALAIIHGSGGEGIAIPKHRNRTNRSNRVNINRNIRAKEVRVIDPDGNQIGVIPTYKAIAVANDFGLDLVEISPNANPPVCKIMDYGRYKYELTKKRQEAYVQKPVNTIFRPKLIISKSSLKERTRSR